MAKVEILQPREQQSHFGLYRQGVGGVQSIIIRRKVGDPTDYLHANSRKVQLQREYLSLASQHYATLTPTQKAKTRHQFEEVEFVNSHGKSDTKLLTGRQLFISKEIDSLAHTGKQLTLPLEICIVLTDEALERIPGDLWLSYQDIAEWPYCDRERLSLSDWLFPNTPAGKPVYHPYGESPGYIDEQSAATTYLSESKLKAYHYHPLKYIGGILDQLWQLPYLYLHGSCVGWETSVPFQVPEGVQQVAIYEEIYSTGLEGFHTTNFEAGYWPLTPPVIIFDKTRPVWWQDHVHYFYFTIRTVSGLQPGGYYNIHQILTSEKQPFFWWKIWLWLLTEPVS